MIFQKIKSSVDLVTVPFYTQWSNCIVYNWYFYAVDVGYETQSCL